MRIFIEFLNSIRPNKLVVICCLISSISAFNPMEEEKKIANLYKVNGKLSWKREMDKFCESTITNITNKELPRNPWKDYIPWQRNASSQTGATLPSPIKEKAYIDDVNIILPLADCNIVQIEILICVHQFTNKKGILIWNAESYVYSHTEDKIYTFDLKRNKEQCNGAPVDIIEYKKEIISSEYELVPIEYPAVPNEMRRNRDWKVAEQQIVDHDRRVKRLWTWEKKPFCESTSINKEFPGSLWSAYVVSLNVVLPSANCNAVQVEALICVHRYTNEQGILVWNEESYVGSPMDEQIHIYTFNLRRNKDECNGIPLNLIDYKERISSAYGLEPIKTYVDYGQLPLIDPRHLVDHWEKNLAEFYEANKTPIEWKWEIVPFCESRSDGGSFLGANITKGQVVLPRADCALVEMEILNCEYRVKLKGGRSEWNRKFYVNGRNYDIFTLDSVDQHSKCGEKRHPEYYWYREIDYKITSGERRPITTRSSEGKSLFDSKFFGGTSKANETQHTVHLGGNIYL